MTRFHWFLSAAILAGVLFGSAAAAGDAAPTTTVLDLGSRRELFVDRFLIDRMSGTVLNLHEPRLAPPTTEPADNLEYGTVIKDGGLYRLYTRDGRGAKADGDPGEVTRYCESRDGIHWSKPKLGLYEIDGSKDNNYSTSAGGSLRVELQDAEGNPLPGFTLADCRNLVGDAIEQQVTWAKGGNLAPLAGRTVRLRFVLQEADLFALQFHPKEPKVERGKE